MIALFQGHKITVVKKDRVKRLPAAFFLPGLPNYVAELFAIPDALGADIWHCFHAYFGKPGAC
jgi:hypothetical protein